MTYSYTALSCFQPPESYRYPYDQPPPRPFFQLFPSHLLPPSSLFLITTSASFSYHCPRSSRFASTTPCVPLRSLPLRSRTTIIHTLSTQLFLDLCFPSYSLPRIACLYICTYIVTISPSFYRTASILGASLAPSLPTIPPTILPSVPAVSPLLTTLYRPVLYYTISADVCPCFTTHFSIPLPPICRVRFFSFRIIPSSTFFLPSSLVSFSLYRLLFERSFISLSCFFLLNFCKLGNLFLCCLFSHATSFSLPLSKFRSFRQRFVSVASADSFTQTIFKTCFQVSKNI